MNKEPVNPFPFEIQTLEWIAKNRPEQWSTPKRCPFFEIVWIKKATGSYIIDLEKHAIRENIVYCVDVGQLRLLQTHRPVRGYYLSFSPQFLYLSQDNDWPLFETKGYLQKGMARIIPVDAELQVDMEYIMAEMIKESAHSSFLRDEILRGLLKVLMIYLSRRIGLRKQESAVSRNSELVRRFMTLVENNLTRKKPVSDYAEELGVSANYLNEVIKKYTGLPANHHIHQRKVLEAQRQLICYGLSMKEIAYRLGFDDTAHFSKFFKVNTGLNFKNFRKGALGWNTW